MLLLKTEIKKCNLQSQPVIQRLAKTLPSAFSLSLLFFFSSIEIQILATLTQYVYMQNVNITAQHLAPFLINKVTNVFVMQA